MKFLILRTNCSLFDIEIIKDSQKNKVFESQEEIGLWIFENNFNETDFTIIPFDESFFDLKTILNEHISKI